MSGRIRVQYGQRLAGRLQALLGRLTFSEMRQRAIRKALQHATTVPPLRTLTFITPSPTASDGFSLYLLLLPCPCKRRRL
jgi:hypothetical protein